MPAALKRSILLPLLACLCVLIALSAGAVAWLEHRHINVDMKLRHEQVLKDFASVREATEQHLAVLAPRLAKNTPMRDAFLTNNRKKLANEASEFFGVMSVTEGLETLDFLDDTGRVEFRAENPAKFGDTLQLDVVTKTLADRQPHTSLTTSDNGAYVMTHAWPWMVDGDLIGVVLVSQELQDELLEVHTSQGVDCLIFMEKDLIDQGNWAISGHKIIDSPWSRFSTHILTGISNPELMNPLADYISHNGIDSLANSPRTTIALGGKIYDVIADPITGSDGEVHGQAFMIFDTTEVRHEATIAIFWVIGCSVLISLAVAGIFSNRITRIETNLDAAKVAVEYEHQQRLLASSVADVLLETVPCGVFHMDIEGKYLRCNSTFATMIDRPQGQILGKTVHQVLDFQVAEMFAAADQELIQNGKVQNFECQLMDSIGQVHDAYVCKSAVRDSNGNISGIIGVMMDITARKQAEHAIAESMRFARGALDALPARLAVLDETGVILAANARWHTWISSMGPDVRQLAEGSNCLTACDRTTCLPIESSAAIAAGIRSVINSSQAQFHMECSLGTPENEQWNVVRVVRFSGGGPVRVLVAFDDVTDYHQAMVSREQYAVELLVAKEQVEAKAQELINRTRQLEAARASSENSSRGKSQFLANMSHEVRTPLTPILGYVDMLMQDDLPIDQRHEYLDVIRRHGRRLLQILENVMDISRIEAGRMEPQRQECSSVKILDDLMKTMRPQAEEHGLTLKLKVRQPFPSIVRSDAGRLSQILQNMVNNAITATEKGGITIEVGMDMDSTSGSSMNARMSIAVIDEGCGLSQAQLPEVFEPFTQVQAGLKRNGQGCGLGLSLGRRLARLLGGDIEAQSIPGRGSTFTLTFATGLYSRSTQISSVEQLHRAAEEYAALSDREPEPLPTLAGTVLLVEDSLDNQSLVAQQLRDNGATVVVAGNGVLAMNIALTRDNKIDVVLMDMQMPVMDGLEATQRLRSRGYDKPIVALTAHSAGEHRDKCIAAGCNGFINKPVDLQELIRTLATFLTKHPPAAVA